MLNNCIWLYLIDEDMDGEAVCAALASCPGADCLKDIIKKAGPRLRVYSALRATCLEEEPVSIFLCSCSYTVSGVYLHRVQKVN